MSSSTVLILLSIFVLYYSSESCDMAKECPLKNNVIYASNGTYCHVFPNQCFLDNVNCHRQNNNETKIEILSKDDCQRLCIIKCPKEDDDAQVCGYYSDNAQNQTFTNQCEMDAYVCKTGEPFFVYGVGPCESPDFKEEEAKEEEEEGVLSVN